MRILHVLGSLNRGGVEIWLMDVLRHIDRRRFQMDFLTHHSTEGAFDREAAALGAGIIRFPYARRPHVYAREFPRLLSNYGPYDVVHSHVHLYSGYVLALAAYAGVPCRIAHSHNDTAALEAGRPPIRKLYGACMKAGIRRYATMGLAASRPAASALFGRNWQQDPRWRLLYYGIDGERLRPQSGREQLRNRLGIPADARVVVHVGRFDPQKNHRFLVAIATAAIQQENSLQFVFAGDGPLRADIEALCQSAGILPHCHFLGVRNDIPEILRSADAFLFPSFYEGLGLALIEAQAAGVPCIYSDAVPEETEIVPRLVTKLPLSDGVSGWVSALVGVVSRPPRCLAREAHALFERSCFTIQRSTAALVHCYSEN
jgi:glycosyltransferase involved in cell wall biosynthesis